jgi:hypothetical protein
MSRLTKQSWGFVKELPSPGRMAWLPLTLMLIGVALRLAQYMVNRSLWLDESCLALKILHRSLRQLLEPLDYGQAAPLAFLMVEKLVTQIFGSSEYALRFFPLVCGIGSLFLLHHVSKRLLSPRAMPLALTLFAVSWPLIYYSSELKQYSSDVTITLSLYSLALYALQQDRLGIFSSVLFSTASSIALWFSHPAFFVLAGIAVGSILHRITHPQWISRTMMVLILSTWIINFFLLYSISLRRLSRDASFIDYWAEAFMPFPPTSFSDMKWLFNAFFSLFEIPTPAEITPLDPHFSGLAALGFIIGCRSLFPTVKFIILVLPLMLALLASGFQKYPFYGRFLLFAAPSILILIGEGVSYIQEKTRERGKILGIGFIVLLLLFPGFLAIKMLINPVFVQEIRPIVEYIRTAKCPNDVIYLYPYAYCAFKYYHNRFGYPDDEYITGTDSQGDLQRYKEDLDNLRGRERVWVIFSNSGYEEELFLFYLDTIGRRLDLHREIGASVYLYDLSPRKPN